MPEPHGTGGQVPQSQLATHELRHEPVSADIRGAVKWFIVLGLLLVLALTLCFVVMTELNQRLARNTETPPKPARVSALKTAAPGLEFNSTEPLKKLRALEDQRLHQAGWIDREQGVARIPIDQAMRLVVTRASEKEGETSRTSNDGASSQPQNPPTQEQ